MRKKFKMFLKGLILVLLCTVSFAGKTVFAADDGMVIKQMDINVNVSEANAYDVTEKISVNFLQERHGIYRNIPMNKATVSIKSITDQSGMSYKYTTERVGDDEVITIGDPDNTVTGDMTYILKYEISYKGNLSALSHNIVGTEWATTIDKVNFTINMPKPFNANEINLYAGTLGSTNNNIVSYHVNGNAITGETTAQLSPNEGITINIPVGNNYFTKANLFNIYTFIALILATIVPVLAYFSSTFYIKKKRIVNENSTKVIGFYPPKGFNPIDLAYLAYPNINLTPEQLTSILFYYCNKGLIEIHNINGEYELRKCRNVSRNDFENKYEYDFFENLFDLSQKKDGIVKTSDFKRKKLGFMESFISFSKSENIAKGKYIENLSTSIRLIAFGASFILAIGSVIAYIYSISYNENFSMGFGLGVLIVSAVILFPLSLILRKINFAINSLIIAVISAVCLHLVLTSSIYKSTIIGTIPVVTIYIAICISTAISQALPSIYIHTVDGARLLGETEGYKEFIKTARKDQLEMLIAENPNYYYDILPYAICLNITHVFEDKFKDLKYYQPQWYYGYGNNNSFMYYAFATHYTNQLTNEYKNYIKEQQAARNSSFDGGGGAGGGSVGGGGGGSW